MLRLLILLLLSTTTYAQGIDFFGGSWTEALEKAAAEDKLIFVDAYAEWCGPCKVMAARVFPDAEVGDYFNAQLYQPEVRYGKGRVGRVSQVAYRQRLSYPPVH